MAKQSSRLSQLAPRNRKHPTEKMDSRIVDMKPIQFVDLRNLLEKILERGGVALPECVGLSGSSGRLNCTYSIYLY